MARKLKTDAWLFGGTLVLLAVSMAFVYSASAHRAQLGKNDAEYYLIRQGLWVLLGVALMLVTMRVDYRKWGHPRVIQALVGVTVVGLVAVFFARPVNNAHRWLGIGGVGVQPSEFAKLVVILFAGAVIAARLEARESPLPAFAKVGVLVLVFAALIVSEPDMGSALALTAVGGAVVFTAGIPARWLAALLLTLPVVAYQLAMMEGYRRQRIFAFLAPFEHRREAGFQVVQSLIAVGSGGVLGKGFMQGVQKLFYLPEAHNDFIYAVIAEEKGLVGASLVLACFVLLAWRGFRVAMHAPDAFGSLVAIGITTMIALQALTNMSVVLSLVPAKGIALPFVSAGGSSMLVSLGAMGILLNISQQASATT
ncbi:MAG TPA: putative lipid II flippase FtsW [Vicinamibacterales bacterium]|nr:putative lipid II flippase FtsW [Acidobacteriota bacterium]HOC18103.1 putative lipid II flippase FtsW [Vicinamibacterales bacterium]